MPTYEYRCPRGHEFEKFSPRMNTHPSATCPECGKRARRLISGGAGLFFKGSGFYITDYKRSGEKRDSDTHDAKAHDHKSEAKPDTNSDTKSGTKSDTQPNVVIILADDLGYADIGRFGAQGFETPNLDRMASEGVTFTSFYVSQVS